jgi:hypothetical protein
VSPTVDDARAREAALRAELAAAVAERARAGREAERLDGRATLPGADPAVAEAAAAQRRLEAEATAEIARLRAELRRAEGVVVTLEATEDAG